MSAFDEEVAAEEAEKRAPTINDTAWSVPIYTVAASQAAVRVKLVNTVSAPLQAAWAAVPLPSNAQPAAGSDKHLVVWQPSTNKMWEFWGLEKATEGWQASWGGAMQNVSGNPGVYGKEAWPEASTGWGASASSLPIAGGLITLEDLKQGKINHAIAIAVPNVRASRIFVPGPANRRLLERSIIAARGRAPAYRSQPESGGAASTATHARDSRSCAALRDLREGQGSERGPLCTRSDPDGNGTIRGLTRLSRRQSCVAAAGILPVEPSAAAEDGTALKHYPELMRSAGGWKAGAQTPPLWWNIIGTLFTLPD